MNPFVARIRHGSVRGFLRFETYAYQQSCGTGSGYDKEPKGKRFYPMHRFRN